MTDCELLRLVQSYIKAHPGCQKEPLADHIERMEAWVKERER